MDKINFLSLFKRFPAQKEKVKQVIFFLGIHIFSIIILLIVVDLAFGAFLAYKYGVLANSQVPDISGKNFKFDESAFQNILSKIKEREDGFNSVTGGDYASPFR